MSFFFIFTKIINFNSIRSIDKHRNLSIYEWEEQRIAKNKAFMMKIGLTKLNISPKKNDRKKDVKRKEKIIASNSTQRKTRSSSSTTTNAICTTNSLSNQQNFEIGDRVSIEFGITNYEFGIYEGVIIDAKFEIGNPLCLYRIKFDDNDTDNSSRYWEEDYLSGVII